MVRPAIIVLHRHSMPLARRLKGPLNAAIHARDGRQVTGDVVFTDTGAHLRQQFAAGTPIIGICAAGILIRLLAPLLGDKQTEPPVLALSADGQAIVPLLGGHHDGNRLAKQIADLLGTDAAVTTAGDSVFGVALDSPPDDHVLANPSDAKAVMAGLLDGARARMSGDMAFLGTHSLPIAEDGAYLLVSTIEDHAGDRQTLVYHPRQLIIGVGCIRGSRSEVIVNQIRVALAANKLSPHAIASLVSIDIKSDETGLKQAAAELDVPVRFFSADAINAHRDRIVNPSEVVEREVGVPGVAEGAALSAVGPNGRLLVEKQVHPDVTVAIGCLPIPVSDFDGGQRAGRLHVVGVGPGDAVWRTAEATTALSRSTDWVGYGLYLDLVADLTEGKIEHRFDLGAEEVRVRHALELAGEGKEVALICSGDPGIYAMATLVFELLSLEGRDALSPSAGRAEITIVPGISAFQACAARIGAPIGHDFCTISLSDLLTPWTVIERRLEAAAAGDFVVAFYNPRSRKRVTQLADGLAILRQQRPGDTPVVCGYNLGRPTERIEIYNLDEFDPAIVDMLTLVMVGSSTSRRLDRRDGRTHVFTPRGYEKKRTERV